MMKLLMLSLAPALSLAMLAGETVVIPNARCRGFIGIGIMGRGMVHRLLEADVPLVIWNRNLTKAYELRDEWQQIAAQEAGPLAEHLDPAVTVVDTPRQVVEACWRTYLMLSTPEAAASVYEMPDGVLSGVKEGKEIIDCATLRPEDMITNGAAVTQRGGRFLEAPVSGSKGPAEQGTLVFMTGGDEALSREAAEDLAAMGKESVHCGHIGSATRMKLIVNMVMGTQLAAIAEGVALAEGLNVHVGSLQRVLEIGAIGSPMLKVKGPLMASGGAFGAGNPPSNYPANFPLKHAMKDMRFAIGEAKSQLGDQLPGGELPVAGAAHAVFEQASARGYDDADFAAVVEGLRDGYTSASAPQCDHPGTESAAAGGLRRLAQGVHAGGGIQAGGGVHKRRWDTPAEAWLAEWERRFECWWLALPVPSQEVWGVCLGALALHLGARLDDAWRHAQQLGGSTRGSTRASAIAEPGCEWVQKKSFELPQLPALPSESMHFEMPPIPRLVPTWQRLESLSRVREERMGHSKGVAASAVAAGALGGAIMIALGVFVVRARGLRGRLTLTPVTTSGASRVCRGASEASSESDESL